MLLTPALLHKLKAIVQKHHLAFLANVFGHSSVPPGVLADLKAQGLIDGTGTDAIEDAYLLGQVQALLEQPEVATWSLAQLQSYLKANPIPLTSTERAAINAAKASAAHYVVGLGNVVDKDTGAILIEADHAQRAAMRGITQDETARNLARRETTAQLASALGHATQDWARGLSRTAITEKHNAMQTGLADGFRKRFGPRVRVAFLVQPGHCDKCAQLYVGPDGAPRIFWLDQLAGPGANFKKKQVDWVPCVGAVHPHCVPAGTQVETRRGRLPIEQVVPGDQVLTGKGRWRTATHAWRSAYEGDLVVVAGDGFELRATPNHAVLLGDGTWERAENLHAGLDLQGAVDVKLPIPEREAVAVPARSSERRFLARVVYGFDGRGVPVSAVDLDGEFYVWEREVQQEPALVGEEGEGRHWHAPSPGEEVEDRALAGRFKATGLPEDHALDLLGGLLAPAYRSVGGGAERQALRRAHLGEAGALRLACAAGLQPNTPEPQRDGTSGDPMEPSYRLHRETLVEVCAQHDVIEFAPVASGDIAHARSVVRSIVSVNRLPYSGIVYNLTVDEDESYVANGVVAHNCQCQMTRVPFGYGFDEDGDLVPGGDLGIEHDDSKKSLGAVLTSERRHRDEINKSWRRLPARFSFDGMHVAVENDIGDTREWHDRHGKSGKTTMTAPYGYIEGTVGADNEPVDCYVGPNPESEKAFVVDQRVKIPSGGFGSLDEQKVIFGCDSPEQAKRLYLAHMDDPGFFGGMREMSVDALREQLEGLGVTDAAPTLLSGPVLDEPSAFVVQKSMVYSETTDGPGDGLANFAGGAMLQAKAPPRPVHETDFAGTRYLLTDPGNMRSDVTYVRDPHVYDWDQAEDRQSFVFPITTGFGIEHDPDMAEAHNNVEETREMLPAIAKLVLHETRNGVPPYTMIGPGQRSWAALFPDEGDEEKVAKALGVEHAGPHKYTQKHFAHGHWVYEYAEKLGGKVSHHLYDQTQVALKVPPSKIEELKAFRKIHGLDAPVISGSNYAILPIRADELHTKLAKPAFTTHPVPAPTASPVAPGPTLAPKFAHQPDLATKGKGDMLAPQGAGWQLQHGQHVSFKGDGGVILGWDYLGKLVVQADHGGRAHLTHEQVHTIGGKAPHASSFQKLPDQALMRPTPEQKALVWQAVGAKGQGEKPSAYADWLMKRGHEVYLVGGIVRDMVAGTDPKHPLPSKDVLASMNDVDFVSSAPPDTLRRAFELSGNHTPTTPLAFQQKGCVSNGKLDAASLCSEGAYTGEGVFDHDVAKDANRRDFTANALYYDLRNDAVVDPSGYGVSDARAKVLRIVDEGESAKNDKLAMRFFKFRLRGWSGEPKTTAFVVAKVHKELGAMAPDKRARYVAKQLKGQKGGKAALAKLRAVMVADGAGSAYDYLIAPVAKAVVAAMKG